MFKVSSAMRWWHLVSPLTQHWHLLDVNLTRLVSDLGLTCQKYHCMVHKYICMVHIKAAYDKTIRMLSSLIEYDAGLVMVVCNLCHLSFVTWWIRDPLFLCLGLLVRILLSISITWQHNWRRWFQFRVDLWLESVCLVRVFFWWGVHCRSICGWTP
jgi:hypothetical protein